MLSYYKFPNFICVFPYTYVNGNTFLQYHVYNQCTIILKEIFILQFIHVIVSVQFSDIFVRILVFSVSLKILSKMYIILINVIN